MFGKSKKQLKWENEELHKQNLCLKKRIKSLEKINEVNTNKICIETDGSNELSQDLIYQLKKIMSKNSEFIPKTINLTLTNLDGCEISIESINQCLDGRIDLEIIKICKEQIQ